MMMDPVLRLAQQQHMDTLRVHILAALLGDTLVTTPSLSPRLIFFYSLVKLHCKTETR